MKTNSLRKILSGLSLTSALFIFQACYGGPQDYGLDLMIEGHVKSKTTGLPIEGIKVSVESNEQYTLTNNSGRFLIYMESGDSINVLFEDIDSNLYGSYLHKDTILKNATGEIFFDVYLTEK